MARDGSEDVEPRRAAAQCSVFWRESTMERRTTRSDGSAGRSATGRDVRSLRNGTSEVWWSSYHRAMQRTCSHRTASSPGSQRFPMSTETKRSCRDVRWMRRRTRGHSDLAMPSGPVLRRECEDIRYGTLSWFSRHWARPRTPTRTKEDALATVQRLIASDSAATMWHIVLDTVTIHHSESLVLLSWLSAKAEERRR
jgi:hypothetical protein